MDILSSKWISRHMEICYQIAGWSKDPNTKVGAVIVTKDGKPRSWGFNGIPSNVKDLPSRFERPIKYNFFAHAERNAIDLCEVSVKDCILFCTHSPCSDCARGIVSKGIYAVIVDSRNGFLGESFIKRNASSLQCHNSSLEIFTEARVFYYEYNVIGQNLSSIKKTEGEEKNVYPVSIN